MTIARATRLLLAFASLLIVVWSFYDVTVRAVAKHRLEHSKPITLTLLHWGDKAEDVIVNDLIASYEREHPDVHIIRINPTYLNFRPKLKTMMAAGTPPDIFYLPPDVLPELATQGLIKPLDDYVNKELATNPRFLDDFWPILMKAWHYDTATNRVGFGKLYGLPKDCTTTVMYINADLFEKAGVDWRDIQKNGWTWDQFEAAMKKIRALSGTPAVNGHTIFGADLEIWSDSLRNIVWTCGGDFFRKRPDGSDDFHDVLLDEPTCQEAIEIVRRMRIVDRTAYNVTGGKDNNDVAFEQFIAGNIGCDGPVGRWKVPRLMNDVKFHWDCVPVPYKEKKFQASQIYLTAWTMAAHTPYPDQCFDLIKFLCGPEGARQQARAGLAIPPLISVANSPDFLDPPGMPRHDAQIFLDAIGYARIQQLPRQQEWWNDIVSNALNPAIQQGTQTSMESAKEVERQWINVLDSPLNRRTDYPPMRWSIVVWITIATLVTIVAILWAKARRERLGPLDRAQERAGFAFIAPWLIGFFSLTLGPMVVSLLLSFTKWSAMSPMSNAQAVGLANYKQMLLADDVLAKSLRVTFYYVLLAVPISQALALAIAVLMNLKVRGITVFRTIYFVPSVVSGVALAVLWRQIFNNDYGLMNAGLRKVLALIDAIPPDWFGRDAKWWAIPAFVIMGLWGVGGGMIIYLAGLKGIPVSMYEAATIDGASAIRKFWNVTLPMLSPLIFYNLVMGIIGSFQIFTQAQVMTGGGPENWTLFYVLNLYRQAFEFHQMGYASALAWLLFLIVLVVTILIFRASKNLVYYEGLKT